MRKTTKALALTATLWLAGPASAQTSETIIIANDRGGFIGARAREISALNAKGAAVAITGRFCYSACTLYLGADQLCITPDTIFGFHGPSAHGQPLSPARFEHWSQVMAAHYSPQLRAWFLSEARYRLQGYYRLSGQQLIALGYPACAR